MCPPEHDNTRKIQQACDTHSAENTLAALYCAGQHASATYSFDPFTGQACVPQKKNSPGAVPLSPGAAAGLEPPRFCPLCGRRMLVQVHPMGWIATCSRHGSIDSEQEPEGSM